MLRDMANALDAKSRTDLLGTIIDESERLNRFIANLLDMTRLGSGAIVPKTALLDVGELVGSALSRSTKILAKHQVEVTMAPNLPMVELDGVLFEQVLFNLLDNASKYAPEGTTISIKGWRDTSFLVLQIMDEGTGIPVTDLELIFDMFIVPKRVIRCGQGRGLGWRSRAALSKRCTEP